MSTESPLARNFFLGCVQTFENHGKVGNAQASRRPGMSSNQEERVSQSSLGRNNPAKWRTTTLPFKNTPLGGGSVLVRYLLRKRHKEKSSQKDVLGTKRSWKQKPLRHSTTNRSCVAVTPDVNRILLDYCRLHLYVCV